MDTESEPRDSPGVPLTDAVQAEVDRYFRRSEKHARANAKRKPKTAEQKAREALRLRLLRLGKKIEALAEQVEQQQTNRSGGLHWTWSVMKPPADNSDLRSQSAERPGLLDSWERAEREAAAGCELSQAFVADFGPMLRLALELRHERPPERDPDYSPPGDGERAEYWRQRYSR
ncbi:hypothetical protein [Luteimonas lutimaris]|uniref:Uncharacterized protein n=1 Tax=Luteimonas lutimaris TaxID=698645 RepID=A0ABP7MN29_9GAMM